MFFWGFIVGAVISYLVADLLIRWNSKRTNEAREWVDKDNKKQIDAWYEENEKSRDEIDKLEKAIKTGKGLDKIKKELIERDKITGHK